MVLQDFSSYLSYGNGHIFIGSSLFPEYDSWLNVLDISDPTHPAIITSVEIPFGHGMVEIDGDLAYVSSKGYVSSYLTVVDVAEPTHPFVLGTEEYPNYVFDFVVMDGVGYGSAIYSGLSVFDLSNPTDPLFLSNIPVESGALSYAVTPLGDNICLGAAGLYYALPHCESATSIEDVATNSLQMNAAPRLAGARPNPFNPQTSIGFTLTRQQHVQLAIYDLSGRHVITLADKRFNAGRHSLIWGGDDSSGRSVASDVYMIRLEGEKTRDVGKVLLLN